MKRHVVRFVSIAALSAAGLLAVAAPAQADMFSGPNAGFFNGNQSSTVIQAPISVCGNAVAIGGFASARCHGGAYANNGTSSNASAGSRARQRQWVWTFGRTWS